VPHKLHSDTVHLWNGLCLLFDTEQRLHVCDQENVNAELHSLMQIPVQSHFGRNMLKM